MIALVIALQQVLISAGDSVLWFIDEITG